jgi:putative membrane protein
MLLKLIVNALAFYITAYLIPGFEISGWESLLVISVVWGILSITLKPILLLLTLPINIISLGLFTFVINAVLLLIMGRIVSGFSIAGFTTALLASIVLSLVNVFLAKLAK